MGRKLSQHLIKEGFDVRFVNSKLSSKEAKKQTEQDQDDVLALDSDDELEDLVGSIEDKERAMKEKK